MDASTRTADEDAFWDTAFLQAYPACLKSMKQRGPQYCAHQAREVADAALAERRNSQLTETE